MCREPLIKDVMILTVDQNSPLEVFKSGLDFSEALVFTTRVFEELLHETRNHDNLKIHSHSGLNILHPKQIVVTYFIKDIIKTQRSIDNDLWDIVVVPEVVEFIKDALCQSA